MQVAKEGNSSRILLKVPACIKASTIKQFTAQGRALKNSTKWINTPPPSQLASEKSPSEENSVSVPGNISSYYHYSSMTHPCKKLPNIDQPTCCALFRRISSSPKDCYLHRCHSQEVLLIILSLVDNSMHIDGVQLFLATWMSKWGEREGERQKGRRKGRMNWLVNLFSFKKPQ